MKGKYFNAAVPIVAGVVVLLIPVPTGLEPSAWHYFAIFIATILALVLEPLPPAVSGLLAVGLVSALLLVPMSPPPSQPNPSPPAVKPAEAAKPAAGAAVVDTSAGAKKGSDARTGPAVVPAEVKIQAQPAEVVKPVARPRPTPSQQVQWALSGFSDATVWLIFVAFIFALGYEKTGLGKRIALFMIKKLGRRTLGLGYAVALSELALAPFLPSNTARSGGTIYPIIKNIPPLYGSTPQNEPRKIGAYLMWVALASTCVTSTAFLTAFAPNLLALSLVKRIANVSFSWTEWFIYMLPASLVLFLLTPYLVYKIYPPTLKHSEEVPLWAARELAVLGPITRKEKILCFLATGALLLWIFGAHLVNATMVALIAVGLMVVTKVVTWDDVLANKSAWNILFWYGMLMAVADGLNRVGFLKWFCGHMATALSGNSATVVVIGLVVVFWYASFFFASVTALTTALLPPFLLAALLVPGVPVKILIILMCGSLGLRGILTPYSVAPAIIYAGSGYITPKEHWTMGFIFSTIFLVIFLAVTMPYLFMIIR